jgi:membrane-bound metal-dependent hydrolase YbcI (DUF457 family)
MPSPLGHALAGAAIAWVAQSTQRKKSNRFDGVVLAACMCLAIAPDLDFVYRPAHRMMTHSVTAVLFVAVVAWLSARRTYPDRALRLSLVCGLAYGSHLLLDWLGNDTKAPAGVQLAWPFHGTWYISHRRLFAATHTGGMLQPETLAANAVAVLREILILGPVTLAAWLLSRRRF